MLGTISGDHSQAIETASQAVAIFDELSEQPEPNLNLYYQKNIAYQVVADELYETGDFQNARMAYKTAMANLEHVRSNTQDSEEWKAEIAEQIKYLTEKLYSLEE